MPINRNPPDTTTDHSSAGATGGDAPIRGTAEQAEFFWLIAACFFVSGFAALLYETVWLRQFSILLGTSEQALAIVLASYMGGLAFGSWVASRRVDSIARPLLVYGLLEFGIAATALFVPLGLSLARLLQSQWLGGLPEPPPAGTLSQTMFNFATTLGLILIPTALMGATLPLLARHAVRNNEELGPRIGLLYSINTAGAVLGTLLAAFVLMPTVGMRATTWVGAAANLGVFMLVLGLVGRSRSTGELESASVAGEAASTRQSFSMKSKRISKRSRSGSKTVSTPPYVYRRAIGLMGLSGAISFCCEIAFTRMLSHLLGGSVYAFASMLSGFLLGIALGGAIASRWAGTRRIAAVGFIYAQIGAAICTLLAYHMLESATAWDWTTYGGTGDTVVQVMLAILILMPTATCIGIAFPLAIRVLAQDESEAATATAKIYSISTIGGIVGAIATGTVLLPVLAYHGTVGFAVLGNLLIGGLGVFALRLPRKHFCFVAVGLVFLAFARPTFPENITRVSALTAKPTLGRILFNDVGKSATVTVFDQLGKLRFQTNGLPEAVIPGPDTGNTASNEGPWLAALPTILRPGIESMMIIGLGGGGAASGIPPSMKQVDVIELSASVIEANRAVASLRQNDPLQDSRIHLIVNDARSALALTSRRYDSIVSQPSHPWTAGASHLYTREFAEIAKQHLNPGGIFVQWMGIDFIDPELLGNMASTLSSVFPHVHIYQPTGGSLLFVGSNQPLRAIEQSRLQMMPRDQNFYFRMGLSVPEDLMTILAADERGVADLAKGSDQILDERNLLAMRSPSLVHQSMAKDIQQAIEQVHPFSLGIQHVRSLCPTVDMGQLLTRMNFHGNTELIQRYGLGLIPDEEERKLFAAIVDRSNDGNQSWVDFLNGQRQTQTQATAFHVLRVDATGLLLPPLSVKEKNRLTVILSKDHQKLIEIIKATRQNDFALARKNDDFLAKILPSDIAYAEAFKMRIPWRLSKTGNERVRLASEAIALIDEHGAYTNYMDTAFLRATAGVLAGRENVATMTAMKVVSSLEEYLNENDDVPSSNSLTTLGRIGSLLSNPQLLPNTPRDQHRQLMDRIIRLEELLNARAR